ncbi:NAD-dependent succinate-semialdehyde dehydrogenase [Thermosynechococcus sp. QKsg1]|uniref:NAD-dependent succinate-semialdehyde dehydrogenase n=1 Tax=Thermosynechococcus sp. QKsg1 TaxID=3074130 RepID=UPI0028772B3C|nr:NAD-dependent succinate-semialdehyde dehydrogenase [Thermosynechococcus sp. QKsg1]WNC86397.1 NAD-dependent succinate-semialdehyde dehydrogenase [Thermosynechococcus sp. QKsg1]
MAIASVNPTTAEVLKTFSPLGAEEVERAIAQGATTFETYRLTAFEQRAQWLENTANLLQQQRDVLARLMTLEMGKPMTEARAEIDKCAWVCRYYAEQGTAFLRPELIPTEASYSGIHYQPLGIILAVMPWNFPFWQVFRFAAPALMAGNVVLLKHASNVPQCALAIAQLLREAGFPAGVFQTLLILGSAVADLVADPRIKAATLTGSEAAGKSLAQAAGQHLKKTVLELGGSDPFIVMPSANIPQAIATAVQARMINNGQSCIAAKRFIVHEAVYDTFAEGMKAAFETWVIGDPLEPTTQLGPLATAAIRDELHAQVELALAHGAKVFYRRNLDLPSHCQQGYFFAPTMLAEVTPDNPVFTQELFGPVAMLFRVPSLTAAIELANATPFGLGASAWTQESDEAEILVRDLEAGAVFINTMVKSDPRLPFGGIKTSGYGRELGRAGLLEFVNIKTVCRYGDT